MDNKKNEKADKLTGYVQKDKRPRNKRIPGKNLDRNDVNIDKGTKERINSEEPENPTDK